MKKSPTIAVVVALLLVVGIGGQLVAKDPATVELISGEVISLTDYLINGHHGEEHVGSGAYHSEKRGLPIAILDEENDQIYVAVYRGPASANAKLVPLMGMMVNAQGPVYREKGVTLIEIQIVAEQ